MYERGKFSPSLFVESVPVEVEPWRKALMDAAEYIRVHGHCKDGRFENLRGEVCAWGALIRVSDRTTGEDALVVLSRRVGNVPSWNDMQETTPEMVIAVLEQCARS